MNRKDRIVSRLIDSQEPAVRYKVSLNVLRKAPVSVEIRNLQKEVKSSAGRSLVDWGGTSKKRMNEFVTADVKI